MSRVFYFSAGVISLLAGLVGVFLPLLPTTPFVILSAFCFSRSSHRLHRALLSHRLFGPIISEWEQHGVIPLKIKWLSTSMMLLMVSYPLLFKPFDLWLKAVTVAVVLFALAYIWSRPSLPRASEVRELDG